MLQIIEYKPEYKKHFKDLNEAWISKYFVMEAADYLALDNPESYILNKGGHILFALLDEEVVGVCALLKHDDVFELAKMAVSPMAQGKKIGLSLGLAMIEKAKTLGAKKLFLESNTTLEPAINLYYKLGFEVIHGRPSPYERSNIQMEINF